MYLYMADFRFTNEFGSARAVGQVIDVLRRPRLWIPTQADYPAHDAWLEKVEQELLEGTARRALLARYDRKPVGAIVYRRHEEHDNVLEIRNISILPEVKGRRFGSYMLRQVEWEGAEHDFPGVDTVMVDTKITNGAMIDFLRKGNGYKIAEVADIYGDDTGLDAVLTKPLAA